MTHRLVATRLGRLCLLGNLRELLLRKRQVLGAVRWLATVQEHRRRQRCLQQLQEVHEEAELKEQARVYWRKELCLVRRRSRKRSVWKGVTHRLVGMRLGRLCLLGSLRELLLRKRQVLGAVRWLATVQEHRRRRRRLQQLQQVHEEAELKKQARVYRSKELYLVR